MHRVRYVQAALYHWCAIQNSGEYPEFALSWLLGNRKFLQFWSSDPQLQVGENYSYLFNSRSNICKSWCLTLSNRNLPLSSSSTTSRELLSQFSSCSGWRWFDVVKKLKKIAMYWSTSYMIIFVLKPLVVGKLSLFSGMWKDALMHRGGLKGWTHISFPIAVIWSAYWLTLSTLTIH